jgi:hypothetical protein
VVDLWDGRIVSKNDALQLLLIVDYIFDWARDNYREAIIGELRTLAATDSSSLAEDSEIFSLADLSNPFWATETPRAPDNADEIAQETTCQLPEKIRRFDCEEGVVRHAKMIRYCFYGLYIDSDNIRTLLQSLDTPAKSQRAARDLLRLMKSSWRVKTETLDTLEFAWTGYLREHGNLHVAEQECCIRISLCAYMTQVWEQVLELVFVAISQDALVLLLKHANLQRGGLVDISELPFIDADDLIGFLQCARQGPIISTFQAAVRTSCLTSSLGREKDHPGCYFLTSLEPVKRGIRYRLDALILPDQNGQVREMVLAFYYRYKIGMREPEESFLRVSSNNAEQQQTIAESVWPFESLSGLDTAKAMWLSSHSASSTKTSAPLCLYLLDDSICDGRTLLEHSPTTVPLLSRCHDERPGGAQRWNLDIVEEDDTASSDLIKKFQARIESEVQSPWGKQPEKASVSQDGIVEDEFAPLRQKTRKAVWTVLAPDAEDPDQAAREYADFLVARKKNCDSMTMLFAFPRYARSNAVRAKVSPNKPVLESRLDGKSTKQIRREGLQDQVAGIGGIMMQGDRMILADPTRPGHRRDFARSLSPEQELVREEDGVMYSVGDWLEDEEFDSLLKSGAVYERQQVDRDQQAEESSDSNQHPLPYPPSANGNRTEEGYKFLRPHSSKGEPSTTPKPHLDASLSARQNHLSEPHHQIQPQSTIAPGLSIPNVPVSNTTTNKPSKRQRTEQEPDPGESSKRRKEQSPAPQISRDEMDDEEFQHLLNQGFFGAAKD